MRLDPRAFLSFALLSGNVLSQHAYGHAPGLTRDTAPPGAQPYSFDLNAGPELQAVTSEQAATDLEFTTEGGVPYSQPYDYQRIGSDGT